MSKKIAFDTLDYARMLQNGGVDHAEVHSASLANAIVQNIYTKSEVDQMIEKALKEFNERTREFAQRTREIETEMKLLTKEHEKRMDQIYNRAVLTTISVLGTLIVVVGAVSTFAHYLIR